MESNTPSADFLEAAAFLSKSSKTASNETKLELYGIFKTLTEGQSPETKRPSIFDFAGRAKWDAWERAGKEWQSRYREAEERYMEIARGLGWEVGVPQPEPNDHLQGEDDIWDKDDHQPQQNSGGMGTRVSFMAPPEPGPEDQTIHGYTVSGDVESLSSLLEAQPGLNVDEQDIHGYSPLHLACDRGHTLIVKILLEKGADRSLKDPDGFTPLELAEMTENEGILKLLQS